MRVAFVVTDMTMLRYFIPLSMRLAQFAPSIEQTFFLYRGNTKYNGLHHEERYDACIKILKEFCPYALQVLESDVEYDIVFQVEVGSSLRCRKRISIQHGFDYVYKVDELKEQVHLYICSSAFVYADAFARGIPAILSPIPICMWVSDTFIKSDPNFKTALVFYPDQGDTELARQVVESLEALEFCVFVKQRRKHQPITCRGHHIFDDVWYPSEAITLPLSVDFVVGFGSSAYVDLVPMGVSYVNVDIHSKIKPWNSFVHPHVLNYSRIIEEDKVISGIEKIAMTTPRSPSISIDVEQLRIFMLQLLAWSSMQ